MTDIQPVSMEWLAKVIEEVLEPERPIIDPHHHLWKQGLGFDYMLDELWQDTDSGHNITNRLDAASDFILEIPIPPPEGA